MTTGQTQGSLLSTVGPEVYRRNAFRLTGLAVNATNRDIRRRAEQLQVAAQFGADAGNSGGVLPLSEAPGTTAVQEAIERLRDPVHRLLDELFWIWPAPGGGPDEAMAALRRGDPDGALRVWGAQQSKTGPARAIAIHNIAVLLHTRALDKTTVDKTTVDNAAVDLPLWQGAIQYWLALCADESFWELLESRIGELADPRLTRAAAGELRAGLPDAVASINAKLAVRAARDNQRAGATAHVTLVRAALSRPEQADRLLRRELEPDLDRIRSLSSGAERSVESEPESGAQAARSFLDEAEPMIDRLRLVLAPDQPVVQGLCDEVASTAMYCVIPYVNKTRDMAAGRAVLERALQIAATETARTRIRRNLDTVYEQIKIEQENLRITMIYRTCWFDKQRSVVDTDAVERKMYGDVVRQPQYGRTRVTWRSTTIRVPRCGACKQEHQSRLRSMTNLAWILSLCWLVLNAIPFVVGEPGFVCLTLIVSVVGILVTVFVLRAREGMPLEQWQTMRQYPPIKELLDKGWTFGEKPSTN